MPHKYLADFHFIFIYTSNKEEPERGKTLAQKEIEYKHERGKEERISARGLPAAEHHAVVAAARRATTWTLAESSAWQVSTLSTATQFTFGLCGYTKRWWAEVF